jgi:hypothetical protein
MAKRFLLALAAFTLLGALPACKAEYQEPEPIEQPEDSVPGRADSAPGKPDSPGKSEDAPGQEKKIEPAQLACEPSLTVNGIAGIKGAAYETVAFGALPSKLTIEVTDCPNMKLSEAQRDSVAWALNFGGARTNRGSGEIQVSVTKRGAIAREFSRYGSERVILAPESPKVEEGDVRVDAQGGRLITIITKPTRRTTPTNRVDTPVQYTQEVGIAKRASDRDAYPVEIKVNYFSAIGRDMAVVLREE